MAKLNHEEKRLLDSYGKGEWKSVRDAKSKIRRYAEYARYTIRKNKRINIRLTGQDLTGLQTRAFEEGMPYQTLIASVLHKYVAGKLVERTLKR